MNLPCPEHLVPAVHIQFEPEDREWIAQKIIEVLSSGHLTLGKYGAMFEQAFANLCGCQHAVAVSSGTSALEIVMRTLNIKGKEVLISTNTFFATAAAVIHAGGTPLFVDMEPEAFAISPEELARHITPKTVGVIIVHIGGIVTPRIREIQDFCRRKGIWLVEDAAHAHGSSFDGMMAGALGIASAFSFYATKVMTTAEGGMIVTNDGRIAEEARIYRDQGKASFKRNSHVRLGYNWRMSEPHAIIGLRHLDRLASMISNRRRIAAIYDEGLQSLRNLKPLKISSGTFCNYYKYIALLRNDSDRGVIKEKLRKRHGVSLAGEVYEEPLHRQPIFRHYIRSPLIIADEYCARHICLPVFSGMLEEQARQVLDALRAVVG